MPGMNGFSLVSHLTDKYPGIKVIIFSLISDTDTVLTMINAGARAYLHKSADPMELLTAVKSVATKGFHVNGLVSKEYFKLVKGHVGPVSNKAHIILSEREIMLMKLCCTELTYHEIAHRLQLSPKTVDHYRENLFKKLGVRSRTGLVVYCFRNGLVDIFPED